MAPAPTDADMATTSASTASNLWDVNPTANSITPAKDKQSKDKRRQYRSCDRCRSGKRACDAEYISVAEALENKVACSNCRKKGRACSFQYVLSILGGLPTQPINTGSGNGAEAAALQLSSYPPPATADSKTDVAPRKGSVSSSTATDLDARTSPSGVDNGRPICADGPSTSTDVFFKLSPSSHFEEILTSAEAGETTFVGHSCDEQASNATASSRRHGQPAVRSMAKRSLTGWDAGWDRINNDVLQCLQGVSFHSASLRMTSNLDRIYLNDGLIRVYEGAAEQALRCWVTSSNTPYTLDRLSQSSGRDQGANNQLVYWRICELDRGSRALLGRESIKEDREIMEAFHSVILAFAAQWAPRWIHSMGVQDSSCEQAESGGGTGDARGRQNRVRLALWERAREKLQVVAGLDSFRVVFALIIFAWVEKPNEVQERTAATGSGAGIDIEFAADESCALDTCSWQSPAQGTTLMLLAALRKLLSIRCKVESKKRRGLSPWTPSTKLRGRAAHTGQSADPATSAPDDCDGGKIQRGLEQKRDTTLPSTGSAAGSMTSLADSQAAEVKRIESTYHLIFWLGCVIDTETAVLRKHPPVISDEDSEVLRSVPYGDGFGGISEDSEDCGGGGGGGVKRIWDDYIVDYSKRRKTDLASTWPCEEARASATLSFSTPVKVVLFRQISRLQMSFWRRASSENVEQHIASGLAIVEHWNDVYAPLLDSCRAHHATLPPSIQSWYVLIACPYYLAVLLFVEMVQTIDMAGASDVRRRAERARSGTFPRLRSCATGDMASMIEAIQATEFKHGGTFEFVRDSGGTVLHTEPWFEILVASFFTTAHTEIRLHDGLCAQFRWNELEASRTKVQRCLWALKQISDRSPSASLAYEQLNAMAHTRTKQQFHIEQIPLAKPAIPTTTMLQDPSWMPAPSGTTSFEGEGSAGLAPSSLGDAGSLTPSSLVQVLEDFQNQSYGASASSEGDEGRATAAGRFLDMFLDHATDFQHTPQHQQPSSSPEPAGTIQSHGTGVPLRSAVDIETRSDASCSSLESRLFEGGPRRHFAALASASQEGAAWSRSTTSATSAPRSTGDSAVSDKRSHAPTVHRQSEDTSSDSKLDHEPRPRKVLRRHETALSLLQQPRSHHSLVAKGQTARKLHGDLYADVPCRQLADAAARSTAMGEDEETFFSPPLQDRPVYRDEAQMAEEEFYVDGRAAEVLEHHSRVVRERERDRLRRAKKRSRRDRSASPSGSASGSASAGEEEGKSSRQLHLPVVAVEPGAPETDAPAAVCEVDWASIFAMPV